MDEQNPPSIHTTPSGHHLAILIVFVLLGFLASFASGFFLSLYTNPQNLIPPATFPDTFPEITPTETFVPGKYYFSDTIIALNNDASFALAATVSRQDQVSGFSQTTRISLFTDNKWSRYTKEQKLISSAISPNNLINSWIINTDVSRVLKEDVDISLKLDDKTIDIATGLLTNEIGIRSLPGYTKFMSQGISTVNLNGREMPVHILYSRIYSLNSAEIQFLDRPLSSKTDWLAFWDTRGNFYHIDSTTVGQPTPIYASHKIGVWESATGSVVKTFDLELSRDTDKNPTTFVAKLNFPIDKIISFKRLNLIDKSANPSQNWIMGTVQGEVTDANGSVSGVGLVEYVNY